MLLKLFVLLCSTYPVLSQNEIDSNIPILHQPQIDERSELRTFNDSESITVPFTGQQASCPANEVLIQIQNILMKLLGIEDNNDENLKVLDIENNGPFNKESSFNLEKQIEKVFPLSKGNPLRQLLESNHLNNNYKTKITVQYEIPSEPSDVNCKQVLISIMEVLKKANLLHESYRSCGPYDINCPKENVLDMKNIGNQNVFTTNINQGNNNYPPNMMNQKSTDTNIFGSESDMNSFLKYLAWKRNPDFKSIFENHKSREQDNNDVKIQNEITKPNNELTKVFNNDGTEFVQNKQINFPDKNTPYQLHITENVVPPTNLNEFNQKVNISEVFADNSKLDATVPFKNYENKVLNIDDKPDDVLVTVTNDGKIVSVYPSNNNLFGQVQNNLITNKLFTDYDKLQNKESVASHIKNLLNHYLQGNVNNLPKYKMNALLAILKTGGSKSLYQQFPQENIKSYFVNPNIHQYPITNPTLSNSIRQFPYKGGLNDQLHANLNVFNQITNQENLSNHISPYPYVTGNPYVNSKLVDYGKHVNELHTPYNLDYSQRFVGETNQVKLNFAPDNSGVVELTYLLKRPQPVVYQPVYYVKYRLPYDSFVNNLRDLVRRQPELRSNRAKLYQELLALSKVAEVSPNLKGFDQQQLLHMVANNGALIKTKVLKVNETLSDKQLNSIQDLDSNLTPRETNTGTFYGEPNGDVKPGLINKTIEVVFNKTLIEELENFENAKLASSNLSEKDIFNSYKTSTNPSTSTYSLV